MDGQDSGLTAGQPLSSPSFSWDSSTVANGHHTLQLVASDAAGNIGRSSTITVTVANVDTQPPTAPSALAVAVRPTEVDLAWHAATDNVGVDHYVIYRDGADIAQTADASTSYADTAVVPSTSYSYQVQAVDAAGNPSLLSGAKAAVTPAAPDVTAPTAPTGLSATAVSGSEIDLSWKGSSDDTGVTGYDVYRDGKLVATLDPLTSYDDTSVNDASSYSYTVAAFDAAGNVSDLSSPATASTPDVTAPSVPTGLTATAAGGSKVNLAWSAASDNVGVAGYHVYRNGAVVATLTGTSYSDTGLTDATSYRYTVSAYDAAGNGSDASTAATATTDDTETPSVPSGVSATASGGDTVNVSWSAASDNVGVAGYTLFRNGTQITTLTGTSYVDTGLSNVTSYSYTVSAYDAAGNVSALSAPASATTADSTAPSVPTGITATASSGTAVNVTWSAATDNVGVMGYYVYRNTVKVATVTGTAYADAGLTTGASYAYTVAAFDAAGNVSNQSATATATTKDTAAPSVPLGVTAVGATGTSVSVAWSAATDNVGVAGYNVYRNGTRVATLTGTSYTDTGLAGSTSYSYTVNAYDAAGNVSALSAVATAKTVDTIAPSVPTGLKATASGGTTVNLTWTRSTDNVGVTGYNVYRNTVLVATATGASYADTGLTSGTAYSYTVAALDAAGNLSAHSTTATATTADTVAPSVPAGLTATASGGTTVNLAWSAATDNVAVKGYYVYRNGVKIAAAAGTFLRQHRPDQRDDLQLRGRRVRRRRQHQRPIRTATTTTADTAAPSVPAKPTVTAPAYNQVTVTWTASTDNVGVAGYRVYRGGTLLATVVGATSYVDATVAGKTAYSYTVSAYDAAGNASKPSVASPVTTPAPPDTVAPSVPTVLKSTITSAKAVYLTWTASTDNVAVAGYWVYRNGTYVGTSTKANYTDSTAVQAMTYSYTVSAYDAAGNGSAHSAALLVSVPDATAPTAPSAVTLTPGTKSMTVSWTASTDNVAVIGYYVYRNGVKVATVKTGTTLADKNLTTGTSYSYYVVAFDAANNLSPASVTVSAAPH